MKKAGDYVESILRDETEKIISEIPTVFETHKIERIYTFQDGAIIKYEWQSEENSKKDEKYNHRFTLTTLPAENPNSLELGIVKVVLYR
jgi:hypothetical protein